jgi:hypothetical protein
MLGKKHSSNNGWYKPFPNGWPMGKHWIISLVFKAKKDLDLDLSQRTFRFDIYPLVI